MNASPKISIQIFVAQALFIALAAIIAWPNDAQAAVVLSEDFLPRDQANWGSSQHVLVGVDYNGKITIDDGSELTVGSAIVGYDTWCTGTAIVTDSNSKWTIGGDFKVAYYGIGKMEIRDGGKVKNNSGFIGWGLDSDGAVTVSGATWENTGTLIVGRVGDAKLTIDSGGTVSSTDAHIGQNLESYKTATATVTGNGSKWNCNNLYVGERDSNYGGDSNLIVSDGGLIEAAGELEISALGTVDLNGGTIKCDSLTVKKLSNKSGTLNWRSGTIHFNQDLVIEPSSFLQGRVIPASRTLSVTGDLKVALTGTNTLNIGGGTVNST